MIINLFTDARGVHFLAQVKQIFIHIGTYIHVQCRHRKYLWQPNYKFMKPDTVKIVHKKYQTEETRHLVKQCKRPSSYLMISKEKSVHVKDLSLSVKRKTDVNCDSVNYTITHHCVDTSMSLITFDPSPPSLQFHIQNRRNSRQNVHRNTTSNENHCHDIFDGVLERIEIVYHCFLCVN